MLDLVVNLVGSSCISFVSCCFSHDIPGLAFNVWFFIRSRHAEKINYLQDDLSGIFVSWSAQKPWKIGCMGAAGQGPVSSPAAVQAQNLTTCLAVKQASCCLDNNLGIQLLKEAIHFYK